MGGSSGAEIGTVEMLRLMGGAKTGIGSMMGSGRGEKGWVGERGDGEWNQSQY